MQVSRRTGGLEIADVPGGRAVSVSRRTSGLEISHIVELLNI